MKYEAIIKVDRKSFEVINRYLTVQPTCEEEAQHEDDTITYTAKFADGKEVDVKCCGVQFQEGEENTSWTEAILFDKNGSEIVCTDVCDSFLGEWELEDDKGNVYVVNVVVTE